jgi:hemerythrin
MTAAASNVQTLQWTDRFLLGYAPMDEVHEEFVEIVSQMQCASDAEIPGLLDSFITHAKAHFDAEDTWMVETQFPARDCHTAEHAAVMKSVEEVRVLVAQGNYAICRSLAAELAAWFPGHADYLDSALAHWMCKIRLGGKPVVIRRDLTLR